MPLKTVFADSPRVPWEAFGSSALLLHFPFKLRGLVQTSLRLSKAHRDHFSLVTASVFDFVSEESHGA